MLQHMRHYYETWARGTQFFMVADTLYTRS